MRIGARQRFYPHGIGESECEGMKVFEQALEKSHTDSHIKQKKVQLEKAEPKKKMLK